MSATGAPLEQPGMPGGPRPVAAIRESTLRRLLRSAPSLQLVS